MQREIVKPTVDVPLVVRLDQGPQGREKQGNYGTDYEYPVNQGAALMYLQPQAREALIRSGARPGDQVQIVKTLKGKMTSYDVQVFAAPQPIRPNESNGNGSPRARALEQQAALARHVTQAVDPGPHNPPMQPGASQAQESGDQRMGRRVKVCGRIALDAIADWSAYSAQLGIPMRFESDDVRALAITLLIEVNNRERNGVR